MIAYQKEGREIEAEQIDELYVVLRRQYAQYPLMQMQDIYKLLYQNEFGCGYSVTDPTLTWIQLFKQWNDCGPESKDEQLVEDIGNNFHRNNLRPAKKLLASPEAVHDGYVLSVNLMQGNIVGLVEKLLSLPGFFKQEAIDYSGEQLKTFLDDCSARGFPALPHSGIYKETYQPAYRVVNSEQLGRIIESMRAC